MDKRISRRKLVRVLGVTTGLLAGLWLLLCAGAWWAMTQPPEVFGAIMARVPMIAMIIVPFEPLWMHARAGRIAPGDMAPDFTLPTLDHRETVHLAGFRGSRPVVLVFGSYT